MGSLKRQPRSRDQDGRLREGKVPPRNQANQGVRLQGLPLFRSGGAMWAWRFGRRRSRRIARLFLFGYFRFLNGLYLAEGLK